MSINNNTNSINIHQQQQQTEIDIQCGQIQLGIPYRKITQLKFTLLSQEQLKQQYQSPHLHQQPSTSSQVFHISVSCKYQGLTKPQQPTIITRTLSDFQWLESALKQHVENRFVILPMLGRQLPTIKDTLIGYFVSNRLAHQYIQKKIDHHHDKRVISDKSQSQSQKQSNNNDGRKQQQQKHPSNFHKDITHFNLTHTMIQRYMNILSQITVKNLYHKPNQFDNPVFIFIQEEDTYRFYLSLYQKDKKSKESVIKQYFSGLLSYIPTPFSKQKSMKAHGLQLINNQQLILEDKSEQLMQKSHNYNSKLSILLQNFIQKEHRNRIKEKQRRVNEMIRLLNGLVRYQKIIIEEIGANMELYGDSVSSDNVNNTNMNGNNNVNNSTNSNEDNTTKREIQQYTKYINRQKQFIQQAITVIGQQFISDNFGLDNNVQGLSLSKDKQNNHVNSHNRRVRISLGELYDDYY